jgi:hypothetical protein
VVSVLGIREIYCKGKLIKTEKFSFPKLQDYKAIIAEYEQKPYEVPAEVSPESIKELLDKDKQHVTAEVEANYQKYFGDKAETSKVAWSL